MQTESKTGLKITAPRLCVRFGICDRTLDRWLIDPRMSFPRPIYINKRRYWELAEIEEWERAQACRREAA